jgi:hypothetical protein
MKNLFVLAISIIAISFFAGCGDADENEDRPVCRLTVDKTEAVVGDQVTVDAKITDSYIKYVSLKVMSTVNGGVYSDLEQLDLLQDVKLSVYEETFTYTIPAVDASGDSIKANDHVRFILIAFDAADYSGRDEEYIRIQ